MYKKISIAALVILAAFVPLTVLAHANGGHAGSGDGSCRKGPGGFRWFRAVGPNGDLTIEEIVEKMAENLGLTEEEIAEVTPIVQEIADIRAELKTKTDELREVIGEKVDAYRESKMDNGPPAHGKWVRRGRARTCRPSETPVSVEDATEDDVLGMFA